ncbi:hypothetical protein LR48_Vigan11g113500 [Vigna angularis]|uniref:Ubiquitin-like protease family profile domain-containing protein n=1 Tax=Phaseolus angularis TaxID=3914 RepID=A0A0L9VSP1_PHAAN|nr:hypothetical protein LR48_Vigan11g113500 [Vigna angularis]
MSQEALRQMDLQWKERLNQSMRSMEQRLMERLQEQKEIQRALEEKLHFMTQDTMGLPTEAPTAPRVSTRESCSAVDPTEYNDDEMAEAKDDPLSKLMTRLPRLKRGAVEIYWDLKCNKQLDSWECGFYVMSWIKTIIRVAITDEWNERFKSTSPLSEDTIRQIRQEWTAYLLQRWS